MYICIHVFPKSLLAKRSTSVSKGLFFFNWKNLLLMKEMPDFMAELGKIQDEPAQFYANKKSKCQKNYGRMTKGWRKGSSAKIKQFQYQN